VERGCIELRSGLGEIVTENEDFFDSIRKRSGMKNRPLKSSREYKARVEAMPKVQDECGPD
jgi:hypothetical protein